MENNSIGVVIPSYGSLQFLTFSIKSVLNQSIPVDSIVIVNDCPHSELNRLLEKFEACALKSGIDFVILNNPINIGAGASRLRGIEALNTEWVAFLDSDDIWPRDRIEKILTYLEISDFIAGDYIRISGKVTKITSNWRGKKGILKFGNPFGNSTVMVRRELLRRTGYSQLRKRQDWATWQKLILGNEIRVSYVNIPLAIYMDRPNSLSKGLITNIKYSILVYRENNISILCIFPYLIFQAKKKIGLKLQCKNLRF